MKAILTQSKHTRYRDLFHKTITRSPKRVQIIKLITPVSSDTSDLDNFVGAVKPLKDEEVFEFKCLYRKESSPYDEGLVGFQKYKDATVYISPLQLELVFGNFRLDPTQYQIILDGTTYNIVKISYKEELYESCVAVVFDLKDELRG